MNTDTTVPKVRIATLPDLFVDCFVKTRLDSKTGNYIALRIACMTTPFVTTEAQRFKEVGNGSLMTFEMMNSPQTHKLDGNRQS
jgi:hypothetical protein